MAKIISYQKKEIVCPSCWAIIEYGIKDIFGKEEQKENPFIPKQYVYCPGCQKKIYI